MMSGFGPTAHSAGLRSGWEHVALLNCCPLPSVSHLLCCVNKNVRKSLFNSCRQRCWRFQYLLPSFENVLGLQKRSRQPAGLNNFV